MFFLSIVGVFRTILILIGIFTIIRYVGRIMMNKRNAQEEQKRQQAKRDFHLEKKKSKERIGEIRIVKGDKMNAEDVDFEILEGKEEK